MTTLNELCNEAVLAYARLVKLNPKSFTDDEIIEDLNRSRELDPTGLTTFLMVQGQLDAFLEEQQFSAKAIFANWDKFKKRMDSFERVRAIVNHPDTTALREQYVDAVRLVARNMGREKDDLDKVFESPIDLGYLRWSAFKSSVDLETFQFTHGDPDPNPLGVNNMVFEFWNVNSLLRLMQAQGAPGVTMCLIRDPAVAEASYFVFAIKDGDRITMLTDREIGAHPLFWKMSRRPGRYLERRAARNWFPYELLNLKRTAKGDLYVEKRNALVPIQAKMIPLMKVSDLPAPEFVWTVLTMELLARKHHGTDRKQLPLAYTGEMVIVPDALVSAGSALARKGYEPLRLEPLTADALDRSDMRLERERTGFNDWLVERHKDQVPDEVLNVVGQEQARLVGEKHRKLLGPPNDNWADKRPAPLHVEGLSPVTFGTAEQIAADRVWLARKNQAEAIEELARREFEANEKAVRRWIREKLMGQIQVLTEAAARQSFESDVKLFRGFADDDFDEDRKVTEKIERQNLLTNQALLLRKGFGIYSSFTMPNYEASGSYCLGPWDERYKRWLCAVQRDVGASVFTRFEPQCPTSLAALLGVEVVELPVWLQHWYATEPYSGNCILDRLDPADWAIKNPWHEKWRISITLPLCKRVFAAERKRLGLTPEPRGREPGSDENRTKGKPDYIVYFPTEGWV